MTEPPSPRDPRWIGIIGVVAISFAAILVRASEVSPSTSAVFRAAYAVPGLVLLTWLWGRGDDRPAKLRWTAVLAGAFLGADLTVWHHSIGYIGAGLATVLANLQVVFVALLAWQIHGERPGTMALIGGPVALIGVALTSGLGQAEAYGSAPVLGALLATAAAVLYAGFLLLFRHANRQQGPTAGPLLDATLGTLAATLILGLATDPRLTLVPAWPAHAWLILLGVGVHTVGWLTLAYALPRLPAVVTSILLLLQPMLTVLWGVVFFQEAPSLLQWIGVGLVLAGVGAASLRARRDQEDQGARPA